MSESQIPKQTAPGFISLSTTGTNTQIHKIDRHQSRLKRMKHGTLTAARLHEEDLQETKSRYRRAMVTLTYRNVDDWCADDISYFMRLVRQWCKRRQMKSVMSGSLNYKNVALCIITLCSGYHAASRCPNQINKVGGHTA